MDRNDLTAILNALEQQRLVLCEIRDRLEVGVLSQCNTAPAGAPIEGIGGMFAGLPEHHQPTAGRVR